MIERRGQAKCICMFSLLPSLDSVPYHLSHCDVHATGERDHLSAISDGAGTRGSLSVGV